KASAPVLQKDGDRDHADGIADLRWQDDVTLHFIGRLQTNKVKKVTRLFHYIHSVDRDSLAQALAQDKQQWQEKKPFPQLLLEVNVGEEPQKGGVPPSDLHDFYRRCRQQYDLPIVGLMAILPPQLPAAPFFFFLKQQADMLGLKELSMGMSQDYGAAVELGATMVRLGAALFGARA
ncbi:MAG: alanine racemase, partial [Alphaproteobacteria bacterium]|nr:alanine racemase [Alphaproteobacteria bacterium]